jgi:hypothetical protein
MEQWSVWLAFEQATLRTLAAAAGAPRGVFAGARRQMADPRADASEPPPFRRVSEDCQAATRCRRWRRLAAKRGALRKFVGLHQTTPTGSVFEHWFAHPPC